MMPPLSPHRELQPFDLKATAAVIAESQCADGRIPWYTGAKTDPWDLVEAAMGLTVGGYVADARRAYDWLAQMQLADGSWYASYQDNQPIDRTRETHLSCYIAVGLRHDFLTTGDLPYLQSMWPILERAIDFAIRHQAPGGEIYWAVSPGGQVDPMALLTGASSIHKSLECALLLSRDLGLSRPEWERARRKLAGAIRNKPHNFNMTKARFSMDWFYPILGGALTGPAAVRRIDRYWKKFVIEGQGVRCVSDQPWVTIAETCELVLALAAMGNTEQARIVFNWIVERRQTDGFYWCGYTFPEMAIWPEEPTTWTNGAVLLAADALYGITPAAGIFIHPQGKP
jgi:hypothetical protein